MKRCRFMEEQIIGILKKQEAGLKVSDLFRDHDFTALQIDDPPQQLRPVAPRAH